MIVLADIMYKLNVGLKVRKNDRLHQANWEKMVAVSTIMKETLSTKGKFIFIIEAYVKKAIVKKGMARISKSNIF